MVAVADAKEAHLGPKKLLESGMYEDAVSRAYYAAFHAAKAALLAVGDDPKSHDEVLHLFGPRFIRSGIFDRSLGVTLRRLKEMRETADYNILAYFSEDEVEYAVRSAEEFIRRIEEFVKNLLGGE